MIQLLYLFCTLIIITVSSGPIPVPSFNLSNITGNWNIIWRFDYFDPASLSTQVSCDIVNINYSESQVFWNESITINGTLYDYSTKFLPNQTRNSKWTSLQSSYKLYVLFYEPLDFKYWVLGTDDKIAMILSNSLNISIQSVEAVKILLIRENFMVNSTNSYYIDNRNC
jgi:lipocalin